jgi:hypothetical protein
VSRALILAALLALAACGGTDDDEPRDQINPPKCTAGACA